MATTAEHVIRRTRNAADSIDLAGIRKQLDKTFRNARKNASRAADRGITATDRYVHRNPWTAMAVAAGAVALAGIAIAGVVRSRSQSRRWFNQFR